MGIFDSLFSKKTDFKAGGVRLEGIPLSASLLKSPTNFVAPAKLDFRDMCIQTSNQLQTPHCAGYSTAGFIEVQNWRTLHYPEQINGDAIYDAAKKLDGYPGDGTSLNCAAKGAINLGLINGSIEFIGRDSQKVRFAIHENCVCIGAFGITNEWNNVGRDGKIPNYGNAAKDIGGHAVLICGYDGEGIYIQNSWGVSWGLYGFCFLSWEQFEWQFDSGAIIRRSA